MTDINAGHEAAQSQALAVSICPSRNGYELHIISYRHHILYTIPHATGGHISRDMLPSVEPSGTKLGNN